jgi:hypothetical protein
MGPLINVSASDADAGTKLREQVSKYMANFDAENSVVSRIAGSYWNQNHDFSAD